MRQHRLEQQAARTEQAAAAARAERTAQHAADRVVFAPALDREWTAAADLADLGRAWGAAAGWADTDPTANVAATRVETRLSEMAPAAMARFDELRDAGTDRLEAMREVLAHVAAQANYRPRVFVAEPASADTTAGDAADEARASDANAAEAARRSEAAADHFPRPYTHIGAGSTGKTVATTTPVAARGRTRALSR